MNTPNNTIEHDSAMQELRELLFKSESARINEIERILNNQELHAQEIAKILAEAVKIRSKADNKLGQALTPAVEEALKASIARDPKPISDALFPVMGPAIRKAINSSIAAMMQSLNQTLEHSFSAQGLRWRLDALKTGKPFAEVVLLNTLVYRVEQVFLIHKETGLLLHHLSFDPALNEDADVVSSMLTAVRDFIHDSFSGNADQEIENLRMGDLEIMIEQAPDVVLAVVSRGNPPRSLQDGMQPVLEEIQQDFHDELQQFEGNTDDFETTDVLLSNLMVADYQGQSKKQSSKKPIVVLGLICLSIVSWLTWNYQQQTALETKWQEYIQTLSQQPGIIITRISHDDGHYTLSGLRDPLSINPLQQLKQAGLPQDKLKLEFQTYQALQPSLILKRTIALLRPPQSAELTLQEQTLFLSGIAPTTWIKHAITTAPFIAGIQNVDAGHIAPAISLLERIHQQLQPTKYIHLKLITDKQLVVSGEATSAWAKQAKINIQNIKEISLYDDKKITLIDSPQYLVQQAYQKLKPPKTVQLVVTPKRVLIASGTAPSAWIKKAKQKATKLTYITAYRDTQLSLSADAILQRAISLLQPPETVTLSLTKHILMATGVAPQTWINNAYKNALTIEEIDTFDNQTSPLRDDATILAELIQRLQPPSSVTLTFSQGILHATGRATESWIQAAENKFILVDGVYSFYTSKLQNTTKTWQAIQQEIAQINIQFSPTLAQLTPKINEKVKHLSALFKQASAIHKSSHLVIKAPYQRNDVFLASLRLKSIKKALQAEGVDAEYIKTNTVKSEVTETIQTIETSLIMREVAP